MHYQLTGVFIGSTLDVSVLALPDEQHLDTDLLFGLFSGTCVPDDLDVEVDLLVVCTM